MYVTRALVCFLLAAQILWALPVQASVVKPNDCGHNQQPADPSLGEVEDGCEDKLHSGEFEVFHRLDEVCCVRHLAEFSGEQTNQFARTPEPVVLDLHASRAPPACV